MTCRVAQLRHKEVINSVTGCRIGTVDDVEVDTASARILSIVIYGRGKIFGIWGKCEDYVISWENIVLVGEDTILVKECIRKSAPKRRKSSFFDLFFKKF